MSRNGESEPLKNILNDLFKDNNLESKFLESKIPTIWKEVVGNYISERTLKVYTMNGSLFVHVSSAPLKNEMIHNKAKLISLINDKLGQEVIKDIVIK